MKRGLVVKIPNQAARLKRKVRAHFRLLGFSKALDGTLIPPGLDKQAYRDVHSHQRNEKLNANRAWIERQAPKLVNFFASGEELDVPHIKPKIELVQSGTWQANLFRFASYYWQIPISEGYGRRIRFLVWDECHQKMMGLFALGDAVFNLRVRDELIGWDRHRRVDALVNLMDAYALGAVPPYNMLLGGKVVASLIRTKDVVKAFSEKYQDTVGVISQERKRAQLVAVTTSSALGRSSIYNRLRLNGVQIFESIGSTSGWGHFHISNELFEDLRSYLRDMGDDYPDSHEFGQGPNFRLRVVKRALGGLGIDPDVVRHGLTREVYFCPIATNAIPFLRGQHKRVRYGELPSVEETGAAALDRWIVPRSLRMPDFRSWRREHFLSEIEARPIDRSSGSLCLSG